MDWSKLGNQWKQSKRQTKVAIALACLMILLWGRLLLKDIPKVSTANEMASTEQVASQDQEGFGVEQVGQKQIKQLEKIKESARARGSIFDFEKNRYKRTVLPKYPPASKDVVMDRVDDSAVYESYRFRIEQLNLQSIVRGKPNRVMIDGRIFTEQDEIEGFVIRRIDPEKNSVDLIIDQYVFRMSI